MNKTTRKNTRKNNKKGLRKTRSKIQRGGAEDEDIELLNASSDGNIEKVKYLLNKERHWFIRANVDARTYNNDTPLIIASSIGHIEIVEVLLNNGADVNAKNNCGNTALIIASSEGHIKIVEMLLKKGANLDASNNLNMTALMTASENGHKEVVEMLLDNGPDMKTIEEVHKGVLSNAQNRMNFLNEKRENNEDLKESRQNDLQECKEKILKKQEGEKEIFLKKQEDEKEIFLKKCFEHINRKYRTTPTDNVLKNPDLTREIAKYLRKKCGGKKGRKTSSKRQEGGAGKKNRCSVNPKANKMLLEGVHESCLNKIKNALVDRADINVKGTDGNTALHIAIEDGDIGIVDLLLKNGADIYIENKDGQDAIKLARKYNRNEYIYEDADGNPIELNQYEEANLIFNIENNENQDQMIPGVTIRDGPILTLIKGQDVENQINKHLKDRSRRVVDRKNFSRVVERRIPCELKIKGLEYLGGKRKTRKSKKKNKYLL
jgi:serine/threonine-protein phosphatase 6 regulatory ankyrin repeat subunit B